MLSDTLDRYLLALEARGVSSATRRANRSDLRHFAGWWEQTRRQPFDPSLLVDRDLRAWKRFRQQDEGAAPSTINRGLSTLRAFCAWAVEQQILFENPSLGIPDVTTDPPSPRSLPDEVVDAPLRAAYREPNPVLRARDLALLALLVYAGLRVQEATDVQLRDLDLAGATVTVRSGKGGRARRIPLHSEAVRLLEGYLHKIRCPDGLPTLGSEEERERLLSGQEVTRSGQPVRPGISVGLVRHRVRLLGRSAAVSMKEATTREPDLERRDRLTQFAHLLEHVSPHQLRHSLARRMLKTGAQLNEVQRVLGHSRLSTTGVYLTPSPDDLREAVERSGM
jgi:integrase/recombinase XerC